MIVIKLELWPKGDESRKRDLGTARLVNTCDGTADSGNYKIELLKAEAFSKRNAGKLWRAGKIRGFPRRSKLVGPWELLCCALLSALGKRMERVRGVAIGEGAEP